jgi:hypothetical protein
VNPPAEPASGDSRADSAHHRPDAQRRPVLESPDGRSIGQLLSDVTSNLSTLMNQEIALAKAEVKQAGTRAGKGIGMFVGAGVAGLLFLVFLSVCAWWGLGLSIGLTWSALVVAVAWAVIAGILALVGKKEFERIRALQQTTETLKDVPSALTGHQGGNRS